jgi:hypothetical protein
VLAQACRVCSVLYFVTGGENRNETHAACLRQHWDGKKRFANKGNILIFS